MPDIMNGKPIDNYTNGVYNENKLIEIIKKLNSSNNLFIASNNINYIKNLISNIYYLDIKNKYCSFIEQYICCKSSTFYYLHLENTRFNDNHNRSTWTSFVIDYRKCLLNNCNNNNLRL